MAATSASEFSGSITIPAVGFFDDLARLTIDAQYHRAGTGHELQHLGGDDGLENVGLLQQDQTRVGCGDEGGNFFAGLLIEELTFLRPRDWAKDLIRCFSAPSPRSRK